MTGAKVRDVISRLPDCAGKATDAVFSFHSVLKGKMISNSIKNTERRMPSNLGTRQQRSRRPKIIGQNDRSCGTIGSKLVRTSITRIIVGTNIRRSSVWKKDGEKGCQDGMLVYFCIKQVTFFLEIHVDDVTMATHAEKADEQSRS